MGGIYPMIVLDFRPAVEQSAIPAGASLTT
jgi:hypothetical protein